MPYQTGRNHQINFKLESTFNVAPGATGATGFRPTSGGGLNLTKRVFQSNEIRRDGLQIMGRHGSRSVAGTLNSELSLATHDPLLEAVMRDTWTATLQGTQADFTNISIASNVITANTGSFITKGFRVGDIVRLTNHSVAGNNDRNLRVIALTATTMTISAANVLTDAGADTSFEITRAKKLTRLANTSYLDRSFSVEEYAIDIDQSELYTGVNFSSARIQVAPNGMITVTYGLVGADGSALATGASPYFTDPTLTTSLPLVAADAKLALAGVDVLDLTSFDLTLAINAGGAEVVGSYVTPAMFTNQLAITGSLSALRKDLLKLTDFINETTFSLSLLMVEPDAEPKDYISIFLPAVKFAEVNKNELGANGPRVETLPIMVGFDPSRGSQYDQSAVVFGTSAA